MISQHEVCSRPITITGERIIRILLTNARKTILYVVLSFELELYVLQVIQMEKFSRKQSPGIQIQSSYSICLLCYVGIAKFVLYRSSSVEYLGLTVDSLKMAFIVPCRKIKALAVLRTNILGCKKNTNINTVQRFQGK